jgi:hypothetical protein
MPVRDESHDSVVYKVDLLEFIWSLHLEQLAL